MLPAWETTDNASTCAGILPLSRAVSILLLSTYIGLLVYQMKTHRHLILRHPSILVTPVSPSILGFRGAFSWMLVLGTIMVLLSAILIGSIEAAASTFHLSEVFIATILLPIFGNSAEHTSAIIFAMRNRMDISLGIAVGASVQLSLCLFPMLVLVAWSLDLPDG